MALTDYLRQVEPGGNYRQICVQWALPTDQSLTTNLLDLLSLWRNKRGLFLSDFHGTLASTRGVLHERTLSGLNFLRKCGYPTGIVSGAERGDLGYWEDFVDIVAYCQGALLTKEGKIFAVHCIANLDPVLERVQSIKDFRLHRICTIAVERQQLALEIQAKTRSVSLPEISDALKDYGLHVTRATFVHIGPQTKGQAITEISDALGITEDRPVFFLGNGLNDIEGLDVSLGFVPQNAPPQVKQHAAFILPDIAPRFTSKFLELLTDIVKGGKDEESTYNV